eukprot:gene4576-biopygen14539
MGLIEDVGKLTVLACEGHLVELLAEHLVPLALPHVAAHVDNFFPDHEGEVATHGTARAGGEVPICDLLVPTPPKCKKYDARSMMECVPPTPGPEHEAAGPGAGIMLLHCRINRMCRSSSEPCVAGGIS